MRRVLAITALTWKAAFRFRLFWVLAGLLLATVVGLPLLLKDDGTARGFTQILLTYTLSLTTALLGFATLWLACGTLARDIEDCQMQMIAVKPISRWQVWLGKWLGIVLLDCALLAVAGASVYGLLRWRAQQLPEKERAILRNEIFVARGSLKEPPPELEADTERIFRERIQETPVPAAEQKAVRDAIREQLKAGFQIVPPDHLRRWKIDLGARKNSLRDQPLFLRAKFYAARTNATGTYLGLWQVGVPQQTRLWRRALSQAADTFHEMQVDPNLFDADGKLTVDFVNYNDTALLFPLEDGFEVLYREGGFGLNFIRGLGIVLSWLALLAAVGLAASSLLSFPVAAFFSAGLMVIVFSSGTLATVVEQGTVSGEDHEGGVGQKSPIDLVMVPLFRLILRVTGLAAEFSPVDSLSTGRSVTWGQLGLAWAQTVLLLGGVCGAVGITIFTRRELATASGAT